MDSTPTNGAMVRIGAQVVIKSWLTALTNPLFQVSALKKKLSIIISDESKFFSRSMGAMLIVHDLSPRLEFYMEREWPNNGAVAS